MNILNRVFGAAVSLMFAGCATTVAHDDSEWKRSNPKSILVLPPKNLSPDVKATYSVYSQTQQPLAEAGFYVFPVTLVDETFKANGLSVSDDMHNVDLKRLRQVFGADAVLYLEVQDYGNQYRIISSAATVTAAGKLVDAQNGKVLWQGHATASSDEGNNNQGGLATMLVGAVIQQILGTALDQSHEIAKMTNQRLLSPGTAGGILFGPRSPHFQKP